jgi:hypothetical protein
MGNLRQNETLLQENIKLKKQKEEMNERVNNLLSIISGKMDQMQRSLVELSKRPQVIVRETITKEVRSSEKDTVEKKAITKDIETKPFIPSPNTSGMKMKVNTIKKKKSSIDLDGTADKLSKLNKK